MKNPISTILKWIHLLRYECPPDVAVLIAGTSVKVSATIEDGTARIVTLGPSATLHIPLAPPGAVGKSIWKPIDSGEGR